MPDASPGDVLLKLLTAWNEADAGARDAILDAYLAAAFTYEDPHAPEPMTGKDGMAQYLTVFRDSLPDAILVAQGSPEVTHGTALARARIDRGGSPFARLLFVGSAENGRLTRLTGFVESE